MTIDESQKNRNIVDEAFKDLCDGLIPFVADTVKKQFPQLVEGDRRQLWQLCNPGRQSGSDDDLPEMPDTFTGMDIANILNLIGHNHKTLPCRVVFQKAFGGIVRDSLYGDVRRLKAHRNQWAHRTAQFTLTQVRMVLATASTWLEAIAERHPEVEEQLARLESLQLQVGRPLPDMEVAIQAAVSESLHMQLAAGRAASPRLNLTQSVGESLSLSHPDVASNSTLEPQDAAAYYGNRGVYHLKLQQYQEALDDFSEAISLDPQFAVAYGNRGVCHFMLQQYQEALDDFSKATSLDPQFTGNRGVCHLMLQQYDDAEEYLSKAIILDPQDANAYRNRGICYRDLQRYTEAIGDFAEVIKLNPRNAAEYVNKGLICHLDLQRYEEALADYTIAIYLDPQDALTYNIRGVCNTALQRYTEAEKDFSKAIDLDPQYALTYYNRGGCRRALQQYTEAVKDFSKAIALEPQYAAAYNNRGACNNALQQYTEAVKDFSKAIDLEPQYANPYNNRGACYNALQQYEKAEEDLSKAIDLNPQFALAYRHRGVCYRELQRFEDAVRDFTAALDISPEAQFYQLRGEAYELWGNQSEGAARDERFELAIADFEEADRLRVAQ